MNETCAHCGFGFEYDDETTVEQSQAMIVGHFSVEHADLIGQEGILQHDRATGAVRFVVGPVRF